MKLFISRRASHLEMDEIINFNALTRNKWVAEKAKEIPKGSSVIDVGAGECAYKHLFQHCDYKAQDFCQYSGTTEGTQQEGWEYGLIDYVSDIDNIPVPDKSFDVALCTEVLEHVPKPIEALKEIGRMLKTGGILYLSAPLGSGLHQQPFHFYGGYTPHFYNKFLVEFGFEIIEIKPIGGLFKHVGQELHRVGRVLIDRKSRRFTFFHKFIFMNWLPRYLAKLENDILIDEFTVGYLIKARKISDV
jgi:ubiquinone/menaquinone biosynthesis C-methylase UbiE